MNEQRAQEALSHLQAAAIELVEAARATLDVVDGLVRDPAVLQDLLTTVQETARGAAATARRGPEASGGDADADAGGGPSAPGGGSRVTRINVS